MGLSKEMWQPIETAPKDGARVLLGTPGRVDGLYSFTEEYGWLCSNLEYSPYPDPTHWMPLPEPPSDEDQR